MHSGAGWNTPAIRVFVHLPYHAVCEPDAANHPVLIRVPHRLSLTVSVGLLPHGTGLDDAGADDDERLSLAFL